MKLMSNVAKTRIAFCLDVLLCRCPAYKTRTYLVTGNQRQIDIVHAGQHEFVRSLVHGTLSVDEPTSAPDEPTSVPDEPTREADKFPRRRRGRLVPSRRGFQSMPIRCAEREVGRKLAGMQT
ncbi:hypothetical protein DPMN_120721 [Dreissena polymorpha]|uniref:Uncharacterized protein n=1 Tax=Dreissena polymorpha TaxID=45954 RepID=A0A9D4JNU3_DREPO|nr:hypothetical protein DPMN_120721 [Dreissena polymorpha]